MTYPSEPDPEDRPRGRHGRPPYARWNPLPDEPDPPPDDRPTALPLWTPRSDAPPRPADHDPWTSSEPHRPPDPWLDPGPLSGGPGTATGRRTHHAPRQGGPPSEYGPPEQPYTPYIPYGGPPEPPRPPYPPYGHDPQNPYQGTTYHDDLYGHGGPPPRRNHAPIIALSVGLGVLLLAGGTIGTLNHLSSSASQPKVALPTGVTSAPRQSDPPAAEPTEPAVRPTSSPSDSSRPVPGSPIADTEFGDWSFSLRGLRFEADKVGGWTYDTCDPVDGQGVLARTKCERAVQVAYSAYRGHLKAVRVIMAFPTDKAAGSAVARLKKLSSNAVNIRRDMIHETYAYGQIRANVTKNYVIATIVTADRSAKPKAEKFHLYLQADAMGYVLLRDATVTA